MVTRDEKMWSLLSFPYRKNLPIFKQWGSIQTTAFRVRGGVTTSHNRHSGCETKHSRGARIFLFRQGYSGDMLRVLKLATLLAEVKCYYFFLGHFGYGLADAPSLWFSGDVKTKRSSKKRDLGVWSALKDISWERWPFTFTRDDIHESLVPTLTYLIWSWAHTS